MSSKNRIVYTKTDEAPALATFSLLPIVQSFGKTCGIEFETKDISLAGRILSQFPERLKEDQRIEDALAELGAMTQDPSANIVKLPNISASIPQLKEAVSELQSKGFDVPNFPEAPSNEKEKSIRKIYSKVLGSAVNPVLREGNSDRRVADAVKKYAQANPHRLGEWSKDSKTHVAHMTQGDFYENEKSHVMKNETTLKIEHHDSSGTVTVLKESLPVLEKEVIDSSVMSCKSLCEYYDSEIKKAKEEGVLLSLHLKATMMKVSDPILFGHALVSYLKPVFEKFGKTFEDLGVNPRNGLGDLYKKIETLDSTTKTSIREAIDECFANQAPVAMVDSDKGITNFHVPSDIIIDASVPAALKSSGKMWGPDGELHDTKALIPDRCYARMYQTIIEFCRENGAFDVTTMGNVSNVGLMAKKAEEYGSHDKTFEISSNGRVKVIDEKTGESLMEHEVHQGDIWRMCQTKEVSIKDWVRLAVHRAKQTGQPAVFWLDTARAHDANLISCVETYLNEFKNSDVEVHILSPVDAMKFTLKRVKEGKNTISVTGNVLRDYLTDLFPILELGTSAKMLSIVPLLAGGGLYETGAGGSAPKHVDQFVKENHLRWNSTGEFLALAASFDDLSEKTGDKKIRVLAKTMNLANSKFLVNDKAPSRKVGEIDTRGSHFYLAFYWAQELATQSEDAELREKFAPIAQALESNENQIVNELNEIQGKSVDLEGYYWLQSNPVSRLMRPSTTFNGILDKI